MQKLPSRLQNVVENLRGAALSESRFSVHFACHDKMFIVELVMSCMHMSISFSFWIVHIRDLQNPLKMKILEELF